MSTQINPAVSEAVAAQSIPMMAQVYVRLRHRLREVETLLDQVVRGELLDEAGDVRVAPRQTLEMQAASLRDLAERAHVVPISARAIVGSLVSAQTEPGGPVEAYEIVLPTESNPAARKVAFDSPIGRALLGAEVGDRVAVETPRGQRHLRVIVVRHE